MPAMTSLWPLLVGVLDGIADEREELETLRHAQPAAVAIVGEGFAGNVLHHEEGSPRAGGTGVEHLRDVGMVHHGEGLTLRLEAGDDVPRVHSELDHLQGHTPAHGLRLLGQIDGSHPTLTDLLEELVGPDGRGLVQRGGCRCDGWQPSLEWRRREPSCR